LLILKNRKLPITCSVFFLHSNASASYLGTIPSENEEIYFLSAGGKSTEVYWQWGLSVNPRPPGKKKKKLFVKSFHGCL